MRPLDLLSMAAVGLALSWCVFDLGGRASDPYRISSRKSPAVSRGDAIATRPDGIVPFAAPGTLSAFPARAGHHVAPALDSDLSEQGPFGAQPSRDMEVQSWPDNRATQNTPLRSPAVLHNRAQFGVGTNEGAAERSRKAIAETRHVELSSLATSHSPLDQEVTPAPGRIERPSPAKHLVQKARATTLTRADPHAQYEIRVYADAMLEQVRQRFPTVIKAWEGLR